MTLATWVGNPSYLATTPYLTPAQYKAHRSGISVSSLVPGGSAGDQAAELANLIARASAEADRICRQPLAAGVRSEDARATLRRDGYLVIPTRYSPVRQLLPASV